MGEPVYGVKGSKLEMGKNYPIKRCPVVFHAKTVLRSGEETLHAMRQFRRSLMECENCPAIRDCKLREKLNNEVDIVIAEIIDEWGW
jgi:hypothetical protein